MYPEIANAIWQGSHVFHEGCRLGRNVPACPVSGNCWVWALRIPLSSCMTLGKPLATETLASLWNRIKVVFVPHSCWEDRGKGTTLAWRCSLYPRSPFFFVFPRLQVAVSLSTAPTRLINCVVLQVSLISNRTQEEYHICHKYILGSGAGFSPRRTATFCKVILPCLVLVSQASPPPSSSKSFKMAVFITNKTEKLIYSYKHSTHPRGAL